MQNLWLAYVQSAGPRGLTPMHYSCAMRVLSLFLKSMQLASLVGTGLRQPKPEARSNATLIHLADAPTGFRVPYAILNELSKHRNARCLATPAATALPVTPAPVAVAEALPPASCGRSSTFLAR